MPINCYPAALGAAYAVNRVEIWLRSGRRVAEPDLVETKFNPWHDPKDGRFTFAHQGRNFPRKTSSGAIPSEGPLRGVSPVEKQRAAQINRLVVSKNASARVPITESITLHIEKRGTSVSGSFKKKGRPGSLRFTGTVTAVKGKQEIRIVGMKWDASIGEVSSAPDTLRIYSNSSGLFSQMNRVLHVTFLSRTVAHEKPIPQRLNRVVR